MKEKNGGNNKVLPGDEAGAVAPKEHAKNHKNGKKTDPENEAVSIPKAEYDELKSKALEVDGCKDQLLRVRAEFENARRRLDREKMDHARYAGEQMVTEFLPIVDSLDMAEKYIKEAKDFKAVRDGVDMIHLQIQKFLKDMGLERIKVIGEKFDPHAHEAMEVVPTEDEKEDGRIVAELKAGYRINERLLRPSMVKMMKYQEKKSEDFGQKPDENKQKPEEAKEMNNNLQGG